MLMERMAGAFASALLAAFSLVPPPLLHHSNGATESRAKYVAETNDVESIRPIPCRLAVIAHMYKGLFLLRFLCSETKKGGLCSLLSQPQFNRIGHIQTFGCQPDPLGIGFD